ncbi:hypothetical protein ACOM2C_11605 [Pseudarthrobacter sp. So.54]
MSYSRKGWPGTAGRAPANNEIYLTPAVDVLPNNAPDGPAALRLLLSTQDAAGSAGRAVTLVLSLTGDGEYGNLRLC